MTSPQPASRLSRDPRREREQAVLLAVAAALSLGAALWLLAVPPGLPRLFALAGLAFALVFAHRARDALRAARRAPERFVELGPDALLLRDGGPSRELPWSTVHAVEVDEDRLQVTLLDEDGERLLALEPDFGGLGVYALRDAVAAAWTRGRPPREGCMPENPG